MSRPRSFDSNIVDFARTADKPHGPWPSSSEPLLCAWFKLEKLEYKGTKHDSSVELVEDSIDHGALTVLVPYDDGATTIEVDSSTLLDISDASTDNPFPLVNTVTGDRVYVTGVKDGNSLHVEPTKLAGGISNPIQFIKSNATQPLLGQQPVYRRNVCNFMPSIRFSPPQMLSFDQECLLQHRMSGPVDRTEFTLFFVTRTYSSVGSSPWPLFTAVDTEGNWSYSVQAVMEQRNNANLEARWKIFSGKGSEKTDGLDPTRFHILTVMKTGRLMQLFVDGCKGHPVAEFVIEEDDVVAKINYIFLGADRNCSKFLDGEIAEFLAYSSALTRTQVNGVGKYLSRKFDLPWVWNQPTGENALDSWLASRSQVGKDHSGEGKRRIHSGQAPTTSTKISKQRIEQEIQDHVLGLLSPDLFMHAMEFLATAALDQRKKKLILDNNPFDSLFSYLDSADLPIRSEALRVLCNLCQDDAHAQQEVMARDGLFKLLQCCEPTWKVELQAALAEKNERFSRIEAQHIVLQEQLNDLDATQITKAFQLRLLLGKSEDALLAAKKDADALRGRLDKGLDERNSYNLQRESVKAIAALCEQNEEYQLDFMALNGVVVLNRILDTPSIPLKAAICKAVGALVKSHEVAVSFIENGLIHQVMQLMLLDDPPLQCEAAAVLLRVVQHSDLREGVIEVDKVQAMILSESEDNHVSCTKIIHILSTHDDKMRSDLSRSEGIVEALVSLCGKGNLLLRQNAIRSLAYLSLDAVAAAKMWKANFLSVATELLKESDSVVVTHAIMAVANGCRSEEFSSSLFSLEFVDCLCEVGYRPEIGLQHLICGAFNNLATCKRVQGAILKSNALRYVVRMLKEGTLHARYIAACFVRKLANNAENAERILEAGALAPIVEMAKFPRILLDLPNQMGVSQVGRSLYLHWQAGRCIAALTISPKNHLAILKQGGIFSLIQLCQSGILKLCREGACALSFLADVRCEDEILLEMAENGAIPVLSELARNPDQDTAADAEMALSSLLNFDSTWAN